mmetsp:Transcript_34226/g.81881  ORF Transcript_34226/g.81881 Transcript_34226/m.81881 type:complete len:218 (+) Transcript_34226:601-1254(+)
MAIKFVMDEMPVVLSEEEEATYIQYFAPLTRKQFRRLIDLATIAEYHQGELLTRVNMPCDKLYLILEGTATMKGENGKHISVLQRGSFPNCMSFQRCGWDAKRRWSNDRDKNKPLNTSYATIKCEERVKCLVWDGTELLRLLDHESSENGGSMRLRLDHVVVESMIRRLLVDSEGAKVTDYIKVISQGWADESAKDLKMQSMRTDNRKKQLDHGSQM